MRRAPIRPGRATCWQYGKGQETDEADGHGVAAGPMWSRHPAAAGFVEIVARAVYARAPWTSKLP
ncbi:hypothetical protein ASF20_08715 [Methylobacterium sp. Leaf88]|nr:hypothetical protein ASF20_08715 [Methylobacterium sp. Leaf88]